MNTCWSGGGSDRGRERRPGTAFRTGDLPKTCPEDCPNTYPLGILYFIPRRYIIYKPNYFLLPCQMRSAFNSQHQEMQTGEIRRNILRRGHPHFQGHYNTSATARRQRSAYAIQFRNYGRRPGIPLNNAWSVLTLMCHQTADFCSDKCGFDSKC